MRAQKDFVVKGMSEPAMDGAASTKPKIILVQDSLVKVVAPSVPPPENVILISRGGLSLVNFVIFNENLS